MILHLHDRFNRPIYINDNYLVRFAASSLGTELWLHLDPSPYNVHVLEKPEEILKIIESNS